MSGEDNQLYYVAVKIFLRDGGKLLILKDEYGDWDLPGGRLRESEFNTPLEKVVDREIKEEVGPDVKYKLGEPRAFMRHQRQEQTMAGKPQVKIFAIGYEAGYLGGNIKLSSEHTDLLWVDVKTFKPEKYFKGGWLKGVQDYLKKTN